MAPPTAEITDEAVRLGAKEFREQRYSRALKVFARGIAAAEKDKRILGSYPTSYCSLLDSRSACLERLGNPERALEDADQIIKVYPTSTKGYLRKAKLLRARGDEKEALKVVTKGVREIGRAIDRYGPKRFKVNDALWDRLKDEREELRGKLVKEHRAKKRRRIALKDPMEKLPLEVITMVFDELGPHEYVRCASVSKSWRRIMCSLPSRFARFNLKRDLSKSEFDQFAQFVRDMDLDEIASLQLMPALSSERAIVRGMFELAEERAGFRVRELALPLLQVNNEDLYEAVSGSGSNGSNGSNGAKRIFGGLEKLTLTLPVLHYGYYMNNLLRHCQQLKSLDLRIRNIEFVPSLKFVNEPIQNVFANLEELSLISNEPTAGFSDNFFATNDFSNLTSLKLYRCNATIENLKKCFTPKLESLTLVDTDSVTFRWLGQVLLGCKLKHLSLDLRTVEPYAPMRAAEHLDFLSDLESLTLSRTCIGVHNTLQMLIATKGHLKSLKLISNYKLPFDYGLVATSIPGDRRIFPIEQIPKLCPHLNVLLMDNSTSLTDGAMRRFCNALTPDTPMESLRCLSITGTEVTENGLMYLQSSPLHLTKLSFRGCWIDSRVIDFLRKRVCDDVEF